MSEPSTTRSILRENVELGDFTTYRSGGPARLFAEPSNMSELKWLIDTGLPGEHDILVLGRGSNLVVSDSGFDGLAIKLSGEFTSISVTGTEVTAGGAAPLPRVARSSVDAGLSGLEFLVGIPGSVGGGVRQNAGCFGAEVKDRLIEATVVDLKTGEVSDRGAETFDFAYRHSSVTQHELVVGAVFKGTPGDPGEGRARMREITRWRKENQPGGTLNAGSVFKNPEGISAGELIDRLGLKGTRIGDVAVSEKHANFFVAGPDATSAQIRELVEVVKDAVLEREGTILVPEIQFVGFDS